MSMAMPSAEPPSQPFMRAEDVSKTYGPITVLSGVTLDIFGWRNSCDYRGERGR